MRRSSAAVAPSARARAYTAGSDFFRLRISAAGGLPGRGPAPPRRRRAPPLPQLRQGETAQGEKRVAGVDRLGLAPDGPHGGAVPALGVAVLDIVVHEGEVVYQLEGGRGRGRRGPGSA